MLKPILNDPCEFGWNLIQDINNFYESTMADQWLIKHSCNKKCYKFKKNKWTIFRPMKCAFASIAKINQLKTYYEGLNLFIEIYLGHCQTSPSTCSVVCKTCKTFVKVWKHIFVFLVIQTERKNKKIASNLWCTRQWKYWKITPH